MQLRLELGLPRRAHAQEAQRTLELRLVHAATIAVHAAAIAVHALLDARETVHVELRDQALGQPQHRRALARQRRVEAAAEGDAVLAVPPQRARAAHREDAQRRWR